MASAHRFLCDDHLGRLARWLRACGCDCAWENPLADEDLLRRAEAEGRVVLTRDGALRRKGPGPHLLVRSSDLPDQIRQVVTAFGIDPFERAFTRCIACNGVLEEVAAESVRGEVPPRSLAAFDRFWRCPECRRVLWRGSHVERTERRLREILGWAGPHGG